MSREIKFKVWRTDLKIMMEGKEIPPVLAKNIKDSSQFKWLQYTGLKDCKGVEIYEGDIIKASRFLPSIVKYDSQFAQFVANDINFLDADCSWEVIGNIHTHPELLEE